MTPLRSGGFLGHMLSINNVFTYSDVIKHQGSRLSYKTFEMGILLYVTIPAHMTFYNSHFVVNERQWICIVVTFVIPNF